MGSVASDTIHEPDSTIDECKVPITKEAHFLFIFRVSVTRRLRHSQDPHLIMIPGYSAYISRHLYNCLVASQLPNWWSAVRRGISEDITTRTNLVLLWSLVAKVEALNHGTGIDQLGKGPFHDMVSTDTWKTSARLLSSLRLHLLPQRHKHQRPNPKESDLQPQVTRHPHANPGTPPNRTGHAAGIVTVLNEHADLPVPLMRHLLGQQTDGDCAGEVESERDEKPRREQAAERRAAHGGDGDRDEQAKQAQRTAGREDVPVLHARREHHVGQHEGEGAHAAKRDQVPRDER